MDYKQIEYEIGDWDLPLNLEKGSIIEYNSSYIEVIEIIKIEFGYTTALVTLLIRLI